MKYEWDPKKAAANLAKLRETVRMIGLGKANKREMRRYEKKKA